MQGQWRNGRWTAACLAVVLGASTVWRVGRRWQAHQHQALLTRTQYEPAPPGMVLVPAGEFLMGSDDPAAEPDEHPLRKVFVPAFYIDRFEVTNRRFKEFKKEHTYAEGAEDLPVTFVLRSDAEAFCRWAGRRLPTSAEWEKAARGTDGRRYPWGNQFETNRANVKTDEATDELKPVGSFPAGASPFGAEDMSGNAWEWVADDWVDRGLFGLAQAGEKRAILRGGAHGYSPFQARTSYQGFEAMDSTCHDVGFRCALEAKPFKRSQ